MSGREENSAILMRIEIMTNGRHTFGQKNRPSHHSQAPVEFKCKEHHLRPMIMTLIPRVKHRTGSVMVWEAISWCSAGPITIMYDNVTDKD